MTPMLPATDRSNIQFSNSLSKMRREAAQAQQNKDRMALGAGDGGSLPLAYETTSPWDIWVEGRYSAFDDDAGNLDRDGHVGVLYVGGDYRVAKNMIVGALVQFDWAKDDIRRARLQGRRQRLDDRPVPVGAGAREHLLRPARRLGPLHQRPDARHRHRRLRHLALAGEGRPRRQLVCTTPGASRPRPSSPTSRRAQDAFTNSAGTFVPGQDVSLGRLQFGPEFGYRFAHTADTFIEPFAAIRGVWDFDNPNVAIIDGFVVGPGDFWGRLEGGLNVMTAGGTYVRGSASWDGVGASDYSGYTLQGTVNVPLN